jgi:hypothetical protein
MRKGGWRRANIPWVPAENVRDDGLQEGPILRSKLRETIGTGLGYDTITKAADKPKKTLH